MLLSRGCHEVMIGQCLRVCNVKIRKSLTGAKRGMTFWVAAPSVEQFELFFSKMVKLEEKESPDPKLIFVKFSKLSCSNMFVYSITFSSFLIILVRF